MLLWPGHGPRRPRAEEAGKEARRRERGMIHPEEPELETPQPGNSLARADGGAGRASVPGGPGPGTGTPSSCRGPSPAAEGGRSLSCVDLMEILGEVGAASPLSGWSWSERSSRCLAQVTPAAASVPAEEVWKEGAGRERLELVTPPPPALRYVKRSRGEVGPGERPLWTWEARAPPPPLLRCSHVRGWGRAWEVLTLETRLLGAARFPRPRTRGLANRTQAAGDSQPGMRQGAGCALLPPLCPRAGPTPASAARPWLGAPLRKTRAGAAPRLAAREIPGVAARDLQAAWAGRPELPSRICAPNLAP